LQTTGHDFLDRNVGKKAKPGLKKIVKAGGKAADDFVKPIRHALNESGLRQALKEGKASAREFGQRLAKKANKLLKIIEDSIHNFMCMQGPIAAGVALGMGAIENAAECAAFGSLVAGVLSFMGGNTPAAIALGAKIGADSGIMCNIALGIKTTYDAPTFAGDLQTWACSAANQVTKEKIKGTPPPGNKVIMNFMNNSLKEKARDFAPFAPWMQHIIPTSVRKRMCDASASRCGAAEWGKPLRNAGMCTKKATVLMAKFTAKNKLLISGGKWKDFLVALKDLVTRCNTAITNYKEFSSRQCIGDSQLEWCTRDNFPIPPGEDHRLVCSYGTKKCKAMKEELEAQQFKPLFN